VVVAVERIWKSMPCALMRIGSASSSPPRSSAGIGTMNSDINAALGLVQ